MKNENAINYISDFIEELLPSGTLDHGYGTSRLQYTFRLDTDDQHKVITFGRDVLDDFEIAIKDHEGTTYYNTIENAIKFKLYLELGSDGLIPDFDIVSAILSEKREWLRDDRVDVSFDKELCEVIYAGLKKLANILGQVLESAVVTVKGIENDKKYIEGLIRYYDENKHYTSKRVGIENLGYLKAAIVCEIIDLIQKKKKALVSRVLKEIEKKIYLFVSEIRQDPFVGIRLPECLYEYVYKINLQDSETIQVQEDVRLQLTEQEKEEGDKLNSLLDKLDSNLKKKRDGSWMTFNSVNPDKHSQAANSMVELLDNTIKLLCQGKEFKEYLMEKYESEEEANSVRRMVSNVKTGLHRVKHHPDYRLEIFVKTYLKQAEDILLIILE